MSKKINVGDDVVLKFEKRYTRMSISSHKVYNVDAINSNGTIKLKGHKESFPKNMFDKWKK